MSATELILKATAILVALLAVAQAVLGVLVLTGGQTRGIHNTLAMITVAVGLVAAAAAFFRSRGQENKGLFFHALGVFVLAVVQMGLGEMHMELVHIVMGVAFLVAAVGLATLAIRKPRAAQ